MKQLCFFFVLITLSKFSFAQEVAELPKDETGKLTYYEVVNTTVKEDSLKIRLLSFIAKSKKDIKLNTTQNSKVILARGKFTIQKTTTLLSHPSGEITYQFNFESSTDKYRFWLTNFEFIPYQKDRYGNFVPSTAIGVPLEIEPKKSNAKQWEDYRLQASEYAVNFAKRLKDHLKNKIFTPPPISEKKVVSKSW
ncbi:MAG: DUF4468 domain-containing protein [Pedobacter sp.]|uniref:DUF4468 domain-containing protein n=1 Tax=Pedobacter sp. TaxID=1411316 RepID=UPI002806E76A|nr:DUF4468 domain-containing protein [Pedobacter sp.]MDQ8004008.1 DUF4468 domain-containing protein [Pedobacter sp.]